MNASTTLWRVSPVAWLPIALAVAAESVSNSLRAYGLGSHLDRFTVNYQGVSVSIAGAVLVLAAVAVSLSQARAAWVALTPARPVRQRIVAGFAAVLLLAISITAMASHILEAQRAKVSDEGGARGRYDRAKAAYDTSAAELEKLGNPRPVSVIQAEVQATKIDMVVWRRSAQCSDISREDSKLACKPILDLYKERGASARKAELEPDVGRLRGELAGLDRPAEMTASESAVSGYWAWIMGLGVVFIATFGTVIFANVVAAPAANAVSNRLAPAASLAVTEENTGPREVPDAEIEELKRLLLAAKGPMSNGEIAERLGVVKSEASKRVTKAVEAGLVSRAKVGREVAIRLH